MALYGQRKVTTAEAKEHDTAISAKRTLAIPSNLTERYEYNADSTVLYAGYAPRGLAEGTDGWQLHKYTYTSMQVTKKEVAYGNWTNRASETYG